MSSFTRSRLLAVVGVFCAAVMAAPAVCHAQSSPILGNMNCDSSVDAADIDPFVLALVNPDGPGGYAEMYPDCNMTRANINGDDAIDAADVQAFMGLLFGRPPAGPRIGEYGDSGCLEGSRDEYPWCGDDEFEFTVEGDTLFAVHRNATYNCCRDDIVVDVDVQDGMILLTETEVLTMPCDCMCCYDVDSAVVKLQSGRYTVQYCWEDWETGQTQCHETQITVQGPRVLSYGDSGCYPENESTGLGCPGDDVVEMVLDGDQLHITHSNATYNCCPDEIAVSMVAMGSTLLIDEDEILTSPCWCMCCYDVTSTIGSLTPGTYTVQYCWHDEDTGEDRCQIEEIVVPVPPPVITDTHDSGCLSGFAAATDDWGICPGGDDQISLVLAVDRLVAIHRNATYNCCGDYFTVDMEAGEYTILLVEDEVLDIPCYCLCCYDVITSVRNLAEGVWTVTYCWYDEEWGEDRCVESEVEVAY